jgi:protein-tyrosine phosphatase
MSGLLVRRVGAGLVFDLPAEAQVEYSVSASPDHPGPFWQTASGRVQVRAPADAAQAFVHVHRPGRQVMVGGERLIVLEGALNVRDLGGYRSAAGTMVRWGRLYRGDNPGSLTDADLLLIDRLGLRTVIDHRSASEVAEHGGRLGERGGVTLLKLPIAEHLVEDASPFQRILTKQLLSFSVEDMAELYHRMLLRHARTFGQVVQLAAAADGTPLLFHCIGGKDRAGLTAALILEVLGVDRADVLDDYELTNEYRTHTRMALLRPRLEAAGIEMRAVLALFSAPRPALAAALERLDAEHGGAEGYLVGMAGVPARDIGRLRELLLVH